MIPRELYSLVDYHGPYPLLLWVLEASNQSNLGLKSSSSSRCLYWQELGATKYKGNWNITAIFVHFDCLQFEEVVYHLKPLRIGFGCGFILQIYSKLFISIVAILFYQSIHTNSSTRNVLINLQGPCHEQVNILSRGRNFHPLSLPITAFTGGFTITRLNQAKCFLRIRRAQPGT